jgi:hypothetical protein
MVSNSRLTHCISRAACTKSGDVCPRAMTLAVTFW